MQTNLSLYEKAVYVYTQHTAVYSIQRSIYKETYHYTKTIFPNQNKTAPPLIRARAVSRLVYTSSDPNDRTF